MQIDAGNTMAKTMVNLTMASIDVVKVLGNFKTALEKVSGLVKAFTGGAVEVTGDR